MEEIIRYFAEVCFERFMEEQERIFKNHKGFSDFEKGGEAVCAADEDHYSLQFQNKKGDMLELARYQKAVIPKAAGAEELELCAHDILSAEMGRRSKMERETGKYMEAMTHTLSLQGRNKLSFHIHDYL